MEATFRLLVDASWKKRGVEEITIGSALSLESRRSYQCADLRQVLGDVCPRKAREATLLLPVTSYPKRPLLGFDVSAPDRTTAFLPPRAALAEVEAAFVMWLARQSGISTTAGVRRLLVKICEFTPGRWEKTRRGHRRLRDAVQAHLLDEAGWTLSSDVIARWQDLLQPAAAALAGAIDQPGDPDSSAENPLLAVPLLLNEQRLTEDAIPPLLEEFAAFVQHCETRSAASPLAPHAMLAEYGRRWDAMIECTVPLDGPFIVRAAERRPLDVTLFGRVDLDLTIGDAVSNHVVARVADENVWIKAQDAFAVDGTPLDSRVLDGRRVTREEVAIYTAQPAREYRIRLRLRLVTAGAIRWVYAVIAALITASVAILLRRWPTVTPTDLAVIVIPTTFAASLAVTRERTSLATRLQRGPRDVLLALTALLWTLVVTLYMDDTQVSGHSGQDRCGRICHTPGVRSDSLKSAHHVRRADGEEHR